MSRPEGLVDFNPPGWLNINEFSIQAIVLLRFLVFFWKIDQIARVHIEPSQVDRRH